jgi:hypothetical protein
MFFLIAILEEAIIRTIIIILCITYIIISLTNNSVINNNYGRLHVLVLHFRIPVGTLKNFFEIFRQFGHLPQNISSAVV